MTHFNSLKGKEEFSIIHHHVQTMSTIERKKARKQGEHPVSSHFILELGAKRLEQTLAAVKEAHDNGADLSDLEPELLRMMFYPDDKGNSL